MKIQITEDGGLVEDPETMTSTSDPITLRRNRGFYCMKGWGTRTSHRRWCLSHLGRGQPVCVAMLAWHDEEGYEAWTTNAAFSCGTCLWACSSLMHPNPSYQALNKELCQLSGLGVSDINNRTHQHEEHLLDIRKKQQSNQELYSFDQPPSAEPWTMPDNTDCHKAAGDCDSRLMTIPWVSQLCVLTWVLCGLNLASALGPSQVPKILPIRLAYYKF